MPLPAVLVTPGVSCASVAKLRPAIGSSSISLVVIVVPSADRVVSTSGSSAVTVTASSSAATRSVSASVSFLCHGQRQIGAHQLPESGELGRHFILAGRQAGDLKCAARIGRRGSRLAAVEIANRHRRAGQRRFLFVED